MEGLLRRFPPLSQLTCESGSLAPLVDHVVFGRGARCAVSSWRRSCCPGGASCCGRLEERRCGRDQQGDDMANLMADYFHAHKDASTPDILTHKHAFHVRACEKTVLYVMHAVGASSVYPPPRRIVGTTFRQSETSCFVQKKKCHSKLFVRL